MEAVAGGVVGGGEGAAEAGVMGEGGAEAAEGGRGMAGPTFALTESRVQACSILGGREMEEGLFALLSVATGPCREG